MKKSKKILSIILTVIMILSAIPFAGLTVSAAGSDFTVVDGVLTAYSGTVEYEYDMPGNVTAIGPKAFLNNTVLKYLYIPESVTSIAADAFEGCTSLKVFGGCTHLIKPMTENLGDFFYDHFYYYDSAHANGYCRTCGDEGVFVREHKRLSDGKPYDVLIEYTGNEDKVYIPNDVFSAIGDYAFYNHTEITDIFMFEGIKRIGEFAFESCTNLKSIELSEDLNLLSCGSFVDCINLKSIKIPDGITKIDKYTFLNCSELETVELPDSVTSFELQAFQDCKKLVNINIPDTGDYFGFYKHSFLGCESLTDIKIPSGTSYIGEEAFVGCSGVKSLTFADGCPSLVSIGDYAFSGLSSLETLTLPTNLDDIGIGSFEYCSALKEVSFPIDIRAVNSSAFNGCDSLEKITIGNGRYTIYDSRDNCNALIASSRSILVLGSNKTVIPDSVTGIAENAFTGRKSLKSINIPASVTSISANAFNGCSALESITVDAGNTVYDSRNNCNAIIETATNTLIAGCKNTVIPSTVTSISAKAFSNNKELTSIVIPAGVTEIPDNAFEYCTNLTSVVIPAGVTEIPENAFEYCTNLKSVTIPDTVTTIGKDAFHDCTSLESVVIPDSVTIIDEKAFYGCANLKNVTMSNNVKTIRFKAFGGCTSLKSIILPSSLKSLNQNTFTESPNIVSITLFASDAETIAERAYEYFDDITNLIIPDGVKTIEGYAFRNCYRIKTVVVPASVTTVAPYAFSHCSAITDVYFKGTEEQWNAISMGSYNEYFRDAVIHYNFEQADEPFIDEADFETFKTESGAKIISGFNPGDTTNALDVYLNNGWDVSIKTADGTNRIGTGSVITLTSLKGDLMEYTVVIYGDADGNAWYDAPDSLVVNCLVNGLLSRAQVGEAVWYAADCNHDDVIDENDVALLEQAGLLLASIDQTKSASSLTEDSVFVEYLSLISQKTAANEAPAEEAQADTTPADEPVAGKTTLQKIIDFIIYIFNLITSYISKVF